MRTVHYFLICLMLTAGVRAQEETVNISLDPSYANEVYYKLDTQNENSYQAALWDVAFYRESNFDLGIRVNDGVGIIVYEVANTPAGYDTVDVTDQSGWVQLYNSETVWKDGAFMQGSATYGWGEYNPGTNTVEGTIVFVLEYADGTFRKFFIESYFGGYTFKYSTWDGSDWSADIMETVSNTSNEDRRFNYYSLVNEGALVGEPAATDWDFVFRRYLTYLDPPGQYYPVTGVLTNTSVVVAQVEETGDPNPNDLLYSQDMNIIGSDWKAFTGAWEVYPEQKYYIKYENNTVFRMYFTEFEGQSTGNLTFIMEDVSDILGLGENEAISFGIYPNPSLDRQLTLVYDQSLNSDQTQVAIYNMEGRLVYKNNLNNQAGLYQRDLDLSSLQSGMYMVRVQSGNQSIAKKLVLN